MKKSYRIEVDCANCANKMELAAAKVPGVKAVSISFMTQRMVVEFEDAQEPAAVIDAVVRSCRKIESDFQIYF